MASAAALTTIQKLYIAYYGRPADAGGREYWAGELDKAGGSLAGIINSFAGASEAQALYGAGTTATDRVSALYQNILGRTPDAGGLAFYAGEVSSGRLSLGNLALAILNGVDPTSTDAPLANNRLAVANTFTTQVKDQDYGGDAAAAIARTLLKQVTGDTATASQATSQLSAYLNTMGVATKQPGKFAGLIANGLLTNTAIVSTSLTEQNLESAIQQLPPSAVGAEDAAGIRVTLSGSHVGGVVDSFVIKSLPANGALKIGDTVLTVGTVIPAIHSAAAVTFVPALNFHGSTSFTFAAKNSAGLEDATPAAASIAVMPVNDAPIGAADTFAALPNINTTISAAQLLGNDFDADRDVLFIKSVQSSTGGTVFGDADGNVIFSPSANFSGTATFSYVASDGKGGDSAPIPVTVNVATANRAPVGGADRVATTQNTAATYTPAQLLANDTDADGDALFIKSVSNGTGGTVVRNTNGSVTFTPSANFSGAATFSYVASDGKGGDSAPIPVTVNVATTNRAPVGVTDSVTVTQNTTTVTYSAAQLLANDTDADGDALFIKYVDSSTGGTVVLNVDGTVTFTPNPNYSGMAYGYTYFFYIASDGKGGNTDWTLVNVNVASANNAPIIFGVPSAAERVTVGTPAALSDFSVSDPDGADVNLRVTLTTSNGQINNVSDMDANQPGVQLSGTAASINPILAGATFTATATGPAQIGISVTDGVASSPSTAVYALTAVLPANQAPLLTLPRNTVFSGGVDYSQQNLPLSLKSADINGDGQSDLISIIQGGYQSLVNQGNGGFLRKAYSLDSSFGFEDELHIKDVDKDGNLDILISSSRGDKFYEIKGGNGGAFSAPVSYKFDLYSYPKSITSGDVNGDGFIDVILGYEYKQGVSLFLGRAAGGFETRVDYSLPSNGGTSGTTVTSVDVHGDGRDDLIVTDANNSIYLMAGKSDGKFNPGMKYQTGRNPNSVIGSDLNGDGKPDIITTNGGGGSISVLLNNGSGGLLAQTEYGTGSTPVSVVAKDVNGDGRPDLLVANQAGDSVSVLINRGNGTFNASVNYPTNDYPNSLTSADINNDGWSDILTASGRGFGNSISVRLNGGLTTPYVANDLVQVNNALTLNDPDGNSNWDGGRLSIQITGNAASNDQLTFPDFNQGGNSVWIDEPNSNALMVGNTAIGTANALNANGATAWQFTFNANATNILAQAAARAVSFKNTSDAPPPGVRIVKFTATDKFGASVSADMPVTVFNFKPSVISTSSTNSAMEFKGAEYPQVQEGFLFTTSYSSEQEDYEWAASSHGEVPIELNGVSTIQLSAVGL